MSAPSADGDRFGRFVGDVPGLDVTKRKLYRVEETLLGPPPGDAAATVAGAGGERGDSGMPLSCCLVVGE